MPNLKNKIIEFSNWNLWFYPIQMIISFASSVYLTRIFGVNLYGELNIYMALTTIIAIVSDLGLTGGITKFYPEYQSKNLNFRSYFMIIIMSRIVLMAISAILLLFFPKLFTSASNFDQQYLWIVYVTVFSQIFCDTLVSCNIALINNKPVQISQTINSLALPLLIFLFATKNLRTILILYLVASLMRTIYLAFSLDWQKLFGQGKTGSLVGIWQRSFKNALAKIYFQVLRYGFDLGFLFLLFSDKSYLKQIGWVSLANRLVGQTLNFAAFPLNQMQDTLFAHLYLEKEDHAKLQRIYNRFTKYCCLFTTPLLAILIGFGPVLIKVFFGAEFAPSFFYMAIMAIVMAVSTFFGAAIKMLINFEQHRFYSQISLFFLALMLIMLAVTQRWQRFDLAFILLAVLRASYHYFTHYYLNHKFHLSLDKDWVSKVICCNLVWLLPLFFVKQGLVVQIILGFICAALYLIFQKITHLITLDDKHYFLQLKLPFKHRIIKWL